MKKKSFLFFFFLGIFAIPLFSQVRINGYFSFDYLKDGEQRNLSKGSFQNLAAGILFSGEMGTQFSYTLETVIRRASTVEIAQAWAGYSPSPGFTLKLGCYLVPFGRYNVFHRPYQNVFISVPLNLESTYPALWRDLGVLVEGKIGPLLYSAYIGNGLAESEDLKGGQQFRDNNSDKGKGGRAGLQPFRNLELGFSFYKGGHDEESERDLILQGVDLSWITGGFRLIAEYTKASVENPAPFAEGEAEGYFALFSVNTGSFHPSVGYQRFRYEDSFHGPGFILPAYAGAGIFKDLSRWTLGLVWSPSPNVLIKLEYGSNRDRNLDTKDSVFTAQMAVHF